MTVKQAIRNADTLRPNTIDERMKYNWIYELEGKVAEMMKEETANPFPEDAELLMGFPCENIYELYLCAQYDIYNQDTNLYVTDYQVFNVAYSEAQAYYRRNNIPDTKGCFEVM